MAGNRLDALEADDREGGAEAGSGPVGEDLERLRDKPVRSESVRGESIRAESGRCETVLDESIRVESGRDESVLDGSVQNESIRDELTRNVSPRGDSTLDGSLRNESTRDESGRDESGRAAPGRNRQPGRRSDRSRPAEADNAPPRFRPEQAHGVLVLNKPSGPTSSSCLETIKRRLGQRKIGHAGTLDPMASGVLPVLLGRATKIASYVMEGEKVYLGELTLGLTTDTWDREGKVIEEKSAEGISSEAVEREILSWPAMTEQEIPPYSAVKREGQRLYALARAGRDVPVVVKPIRISRAEVVSIDLPRVRFRVSCSAGSYIRSLAHSLGKRLGVGAILTGLVREQSRPFGLDQAWSLEELLEAPEEFASRVVSIPRALGSWPQVVMTPVQEALVRNGTWLPAPLPQEPEAPEAGGAEAQIGQRRLFVAPDGTPLALVELSPASASPEGERDGRPRWAILRGLW